jgi:hypothetical protein
MEQIMQMNIPIAIDCLASMLRKKKLVSKEKIRKLFEK